MFLHSLEFVNPNGILLIVKLTYHDLPAHLFISKYLDHLHLLVRIHGINHFCKFII